MAMQKWVEPAEIAAAGSRQPPARREYEEDLPDDPIVVALVDQVVTSHDPKAFAELYERFVDRVYRYIYYRTGSQVDAEDLSEQVFLNAWMAMRQFRWQGKPFQAWLYALAHNVLIDHVRRAARTTSLDDRFETAHLAQESATEGMDQWMSADMLARAIRCLPREQQHVIGLRFLEGRDTAEVALLMDTRERTVRELQFRALQQLRRILERQDQGDQW